MLGNASAGETDTANATKLQKDNGKGANLGFEAQLFLAADKLRKNLEPTRPSTSGPSVTIESTAGQSPKTLRSRPRPTPANGARRTFGQASTPCCNIAVR